MSTLYEQAIVPTSSRSGGFELPHPFGNLAALVESQKSEVRRMNEEEAEGSVALVCFSRVALHPSSFILSTGAHGFASSPCDEFALVEDEEVVTNWISFALR